jgi:hypothetical protein
METIEVLEYLKKTKVRIEQEKSVLKYMFKTAFVEHVQKHEFFNINEEGNIFFGSLVQYWKDFADKHNSDERNYLEVNRNLIVEFACLSGDDPNGLTWDQQCEIMFCLKSEKLIHEIGSN